MNFLFKQICIALQVVVLSVGISGIAEAGQDFSAVFGSVGRPDFDVPNHAMVVDSQGAIYLAGPASSGMRATKGAYDSTYNGGKTDIFVAKFDGRSSTPLAVTLLGGAGAESVRALMIDLDGSLVLTGGTDSFNFTPDPDVLRSASNTRKVKTTFIARIDNKLKSLKAVNFLNPGRGMALAGSPDGSIYLVGQTKSANLPPSVSGWDTTFNGGGGDIFLCRLAHSLNILRMTFLGGKGWEIARTIVIDKIGDVVLAGFTNSQDFPVSGNPFGTNLADARGNGFITKFSGDLDIMRTSVTLGGSGHDVINSIVLGTDSSFYVTGLTLSPDFPTTSGSYNESINGGADIFVSRVSENFEKLIASTFFGGSDRDWAFSAAVYDDQGIYIAGDTDSASFPGLGGSTRENCKEGAGDIVVIRLDPNLKMVNEVMFAEGKLNERAPVMIMGNNQRKMIAGLTNSPKFPVGAFRIGKRQNKGYSLFLKNFAQDPASIESPVDP